jgi:hypothetical protein
MGNMLTRAAALVVAALLIIGLAAFVLSDAPREDNDPHILSVNTTNTAEMHTYGLPTKVDVIEWHTHGRWAYMANGHSYVYADLPGGSSVWDELYSIDENPVFKK